MSRKRDLAGTRERVLEAALAELAARGYEAASTNAIAEAAGVAKGLVFHHFGSKEQLFLAVFDRVSERMKAALLADQTPLPTELFARLHAWAMRKLAFAKADPLAFAFVVTATTDPPPNARAAIAERRQKTLSEGWPSFLEGLDPAPLRPGITIADVIETLTLLSDGLERQLLALLKSGQSMEALSERAWKHFERLKLGVYVHDKGSPTTPRAKRAPKTPANR